MMFKKVGSRRGRKDFGNNLHGTNLPPSTLLSLWEGSFPSTPLRR